MFTLTLMIRGQVNPVMLQYEALERAERAYAEAMAEGMGKRTMKDDFGRTFGYDYLSLDVALLENAAKAWEGNRAAELLSLRSRAEMMKTVASDAGLMRAQQMYQMAAASQGAGLVRAS